MNGQLKNQSPRTRTLKTPIVAFEQFEAHDIEEPTGQQGHIVYSGPTIIDKSSWEGYVNELHYSYTSTHFC